MRSRSRQLTAEEERLYKRKKTPETLIVFIIVLFSLFIGLGRDRGLDVGSPIVID